MNLDPELSETVSQMANLDLSDVPAARTAFASLAPEFVPEDDLVVYDELIDGGAGNHIRIRLYRPPSVDQRAACLLYVHGGGFVLGGIESEDPFVRVLSQDLGCLVVSVDYRLAPEHPYPAALDDVTAALEWIHSHAVEMNVDPNRIAIGGDSAGAGLAAATALRARDCDGPSLCFQYLGIPALDDRLETKSMATFHDAPAWSRENAAASWNHYLNTHVPDESGHAAPARAQDLRGLPPTCISISESDVLRDEAMTFAQRLLEAGVTTEMHLFPGTFHGSEFIVPNSEVSRRMRKYKSDALRRGLRISS